MISVIRSSNSSEPSSAAFANFSCQVLRSLATTFAAFAIASFSWASWSLIGADSWVTPGAGGAVACAEAIEEDIEESDDVAAEAEEELGMN